MLKLAPHRSGGTDYVRFSELPATQALSLRNWLPESFVTRLQAEGAEAEDCIEYEDYEFWYEYSRQGESILDEQL